MQKVRAGWSSVCLAIFTIPSPGRFLCSTKKCLTLSLRCGCAISRWKVCHHLRVFDLWRLPESPRGWRRDQRYGKRTLSKNAFSFALFGWNVLIRPYLLSAHCVQSTFIQSKLKLHHIYTQSLSSVPGNESVANFVASSLDCSRCQEIRSHLESPWGALKLGLLSVKLNSWVGS